MFKCNPFVFALLFFSAGCSHFSKSDKPMIDVQKVCREEPKLVERIMVFSKSDFNMAEANKSDISDEEIWDLGTVSKTLYGLDFLQLKFKDNKLKSIWYGPRSSFEDDMEKLGVNLYFVRTKDGKETDNYEQGPFVIKDLQGRDIKLEHNGSASPGVSLTCF